MRESFSGVLFAVGEHSQGKTVFSLNSSWHFATFPQCFEWKTKDRLTNMKHTYLLNSCWFRSRIRDAGQAFYWICSEDLLLGVDTLHFFLRERQCSAY